jgi:hypothetical protein
MSQDEHEDDVPRLGGRALPVAEIRQKLREHGLTAEEVNAMSDQEADHTLYDYVRRLGDHKRNLKRIPELIAAGVITPQEAETLSAKELKDRVGYFLTLKHYNEVMGLDSRPPKVAIEKATRDRQHQHLENQLVTRGELLPVLGDVLGLVAAQAAEIRELRQELRRLSELQFAVFGKQEIFEQLRKLAKTHDVSGFRAEMKLTEQLAASESGTSNENAERDARMARDGEMFAKISGVATYITGLDAGRKVNFDEMEHSVRRARKSFERSLQSKTSGTVAIHVDKLERSKTDK